MDNLLSFYDIIVFRLANCKKMNAIIAMAHMEDAKVLVRTIRAELENLECVGGAEVLRKSLLLNLDDLGSELDLSRLALKLN